MHRHRYRHTALEHFYQEEELGLGHLDYSVPGYLLMHIYPKLVRCKLRPLTPLTHRRPKIRIAALLLIM